MRLKVVMTLSSIRTRRLMVPMCLYLLLVRVMDWGVFRSMWFTLESAVSLTIWVAVLRIFLCWTPSH